jgi:hypothetical protein
MNTAWLLIARYDGLPIIPVDLVCKDFFAPMTLVKFIDKVNHGEIDLPLVRMTDSQKGARGVNLIDLAAYIDARSEAARREVKALRA